MTTEQKREVLRQIEAGGVAFPAATEYELEADGFIETDDGPYAELTPLGRSFINAD